jgi:putative copper resistance protein D
MALTALLGLSPDAPGRLLAALPAHGVPVDQLPPLSVHNALVTWTFEPLPALMVAVAGALYLRGVLSMRRRGDRWGLGRSLSFAAGLIVCVIATQSFLAAYDLALLSVHMVQHMLLSMVAPILLALGAPITLALRTMPRVGRARLLRVIHSPVVKVLTFPLVAFVIYIINPWVLYFSPIYEATLRNPLLHDLNHLHFLLVGCLWFWALLGIDPLPNRPSHPMRLLAAFLTLPFHAFLGITIMGSTRILAEDWYLSLDRTWGPSPLADQQLAGGILWATGDVMALALFLIIAVQWSRASEREARAVDRRLDLAEARAARAAAQRAAAGPGGS